MDEWIVAEVSKNWIGEPRETVLAKDCLNGKFETVINHNWSRGYELHSYQLHRLMTGPETLNETIIAVFRRRRPTEGHG